MEKMVVVVFDSESGAYNGLNAIKQLHQQADLAVFAVAVIAKDADGTVNVRQSADPGPIGTLFGACLGGLIGILAGPAGVAAGMTGGYVGGAMGDLDRMGINLEFLDDVSRVLTPGKAALVAHVDEYWTTPLDTAMQPLGGTVFRKVRSEVVDEQIDRDIRETQAELQALQEEYDAAAAEQKAKIQAKMDATRTKLQTKIDAANKWMKDAEQQAESKVAVLKDQAKAASDKQKAQIEKQVNEIQANLAKRQEKLKQSAASVREALTV
ncbi:DUF1269 domain-containing protein [Leptolyngbya sp. NK1-12]|uniref:DUF1269 domain-containing protein n=1 Tax=Leptolyngbya sp. NK1-12 TaxID=2547451 RepID=A0AA96WM60_9CYAN|nr:DUF1269 domain-containing protein [Elainella sp. C42_A2020_010]RNJ70332.1 MAG: DUF1269 domain-containing protein [Leptolyngbya sp. IPPAS B-1204]WNZ27784.1 DUF1269 domain-containing protein [Leptolyngbya sp. NK1-12]